MIVPGERQYLQQREAVVDSSVSDMKITTLIDEITELGSLISPGAPIDLGIGTGPGLADKDRGEGLAERPVEAGIVGNDEIGGLDERTNRRHVDHLAEDHGIGDAGQPGDIGRDRDARLLQPAVDAGYISDLARFIEREADQAADSDVKPAVIPIKDRPPFRFEAGHRSNQRPASFRH
jgi:hypothetical protein